VTWLSVGKHASRSPVAQEKASAKGHNAEAQVLRRKLRRRALRGDNGDAHKNCVRQVGCALRWIKMELHRMTGRVQQLPVTFRFSTDEMDGVSPASPSIRPARQVDCQDDVVQKRRRSRTGHPKEFLRVVLHVSVKCGGKRISLLGIS
jgi:hypothetical protein